MAELEGLGDPQYISIGFEVHDAEVLHFFIAGLRDFVDVIEIGRVRAKRHSDVIEAQFPLAVQQRHC